MRPKADWATIILTIVTCLTIGVMVGLVIRDWDRFTLMPLNEIGDFLAGTAGTIALIWIVFGYLQQNKALAIQQAELKNSIAEMARSVVEQQRSANTLEQQLKMQQGEILRAINATEESKKPAIDILYRQNNYIELVPNNAYEAVHNFAVTNTGASAIDLIIRQHIGGSFPTVKEFDVLARDTSASFTVPFLRPKFILKDAFPVYLSIEYRNSSTNAKRTYFVLDVPKHGEYSGHMSFGLCDAETVARLEAEIKGSF